MKYVTTKDIEKNSRIEQNSQEVKLCFANLLEFIEDVA